MLPRKTQKPESAPLLIGGPALDLERRLTYRFAFLSGRMMRAAADEYTPRHGIRPASWKTMAAIGRYGPASAKELTSRTTVPPDKITRAVDQLVALGWASRRKDPADRRRVVLQLSKKGMKVYEDIEAVTRKLEQELRSALTVTEQRVFDELLGKLEQRANKILQR